MKYSINPIVWNKGIHEFRKQPSHYPFNPHDHQELIWKKMDSHFLDNNYQAGIIWVPTGGGKTVIGAKWVLKNILNKNRSVIWFTHRLNLLLQAADTFQKIINECSDIQYKYPIRGALIAGSSVNKNSSPTKWEEVNRCDIIFSTIQSATGNEEYIKKYLQQSTGRPFVIIDECHHAQARTYFKILDFVKKDCSAQLLGLSATPFCTNDKDTKRLQRLFNPKLDGENDQLSCYIHQITREELIEKKILKNFVPKDPINTSINGRRYISNHDSNGSIINEFGELKPAILQKMAEDPERNKYILDTYLNQIDTFEKTIIFTPNKKANQYLCELFKKANIFADYVDTDRTPQDNQRILEDFRNNDEFKVLINVQIATEGYDAPKTKTVFITRPTRSSGLVQQMIGRALRGIKAGGIHELGHIVSFCDEWGELYKEPTIKDIVKIIDTTITGIIAPPVPPPEFEEYKRIITEIISHTDAHLIYYPSLQSTLDHFPIGYYRIENVSNDESSRELVTSFIPIFKNIESWEQKFKEKVKQGIYSREDCKTQDLFTGLPEPHLPTESLLQLYDLYTDNSIPEYELFESTSKLHEFIQTTLLKDSEQMSSEKREIIDSLYHNRKEIEQDRQYFKNNEMIQRQIANYHAYLHNQTNVVSSFKKGHFSTSLGIQVIAKRVGEINSIFAPINTYLQSLLNINWLNQEQTSQSQFWGYVNYHDQSIHISKYIDSIHVPLLVKEYILFHLAFHMIMQTVSEKEISYLERGFKPSKEAKEEKVRLKTSNPNLRKLIDYGGVYFSFHNIDEDTQVLNDDISFCHKFLALYEFILREDGQLQISDNCYLKL